MGKRRQLNKNQDLTLFEEVNGLCPLCGKSLLDKKNGKERFQGERAHIYPHSPTDKQLEELKDVPLPTDKESLENLILLCFDCHKKYDYDTTRDDYLKLFEIKQNLLTRRKTKEELSYITITDDINQVLQALSSLEHKEAKDLNFDVYFIKKKIPNDLLLQEKIVEHVTSYYKVITTLFKEMDNLKSNTFNLIAATIKTAYMKTINGNPRVDKEQIFNSLVSWLESKTNGKRTACEIVISYFVQNCEVFDASTK